MERSALTMHATMLSSQPAIIYWQAQTVALIHEVYRLRAEGVACYFTIDAGANVKLLYLAAYHEQIAQALRRCAVAVLWASPWA